VDGELKGGLGHRERAARPGPLSGRRAHLGQYFARLLHGNALNCVGLAVNAALEAIFGILLRSLGRSAGRRFSAKGRGLLSGNGV
jgi:hypothetical protein